MKVIRPGMLVMKIKHRGSVECSVLSLQGVPIVVLPLGTIGTARHYEPNNAQWVVEFNSETMYCAPYHLLPISNPVAELGNDTYMEYGTKVPVKENA